MNLSRVLLLSTERTRKTQKQLFSTRQPETIYRCCCQHSLDTNVTTLTVANQVARAVVFADSAIGANLLKIILQLYRRLKFKLEIMF